MAVIFRNLASILLLANYIKAYRNKPVDLRCEDNNYPDKSGCKTADDQCLWIRGFRISCESDLYKRNTNYKGVMVYEDGTWNDGNENKIYAGYTIIVDAEKKSSSLSRSENQKLEQFKRAQRKNGGSTGIHAYAVWKKFGKGPEEMEKKYGMKFAAFEYKTRTIRRNKVNLNVRKSGFDYLIGEEERIVKALMNAWKANGIRFTIWAPRYDGTPNLSGYLD